jgi:uncharacterized membrane protein YkoI
MKPIVALLLTAAFAAALPGAAAAQRAPDSLGADWRPRQDEARGGVRAGRMVPLSRVIEEISRRTPGRVLDAGLEGSRYRVRWATNDGRRIDYIVDAETGAILSANGGD